MKAYVLVETNAGKTKSVKRALAKLKPGKCRIESLDAVTGPFDYIAVVQGPTLDDIGSARDGGDRRHRRRHPHDHLPGGLDRMSRLSRPALGALVACALLAGVGASEPRRPRRRSRSTFRSRSSWTSDSAAQVSAKQAYNEAVERTTRGSTTTT